MQFPELCFTEAGIYSYTIRETTPSNKFWQTDRREFRVIITIEKDANGNLVSFVDYPDGYPEFVNKYSPPIVYKRYCKYCYDYYESCDYDHCTFKCSKHCQNNTS